MHIGMLYYRGCCEIPFSSRLTSGYYLLCSRLAVRKCRVNNLSCRLIAAVWIRLAIKMVRGTRHWALHEIKISLTKNTETKTCCLKRGNQFLPKVQQQERYPGLTNEGLDIFRIRTLAKYIRLVCNRTGIPV